jgi:general secretion pathway protein C
MQTDAYRLWFTRIVTFAISALAAASVVYWGLKGWGPSAPTTVSAVAAAPSAPVNAQAVARALGGGQAAAAAAPDAAPADSRYALVGVVAKNPNAGAALISVDGQEPRPIRVGTLVSEEMVLESVTGRRAILSSTTDTSVKFTLELPPLDN